MSILTDNLWPKDIPESGRLIALIRMLQISGVDMNNMGGIDTFDVGFAAAKVEFQAEIERLNGLVAMQAEAIKSLAFAYESGGKILPKYVNIALSASSDTVSAWKREVQAEALEKAAKEMHLRRFELPSDAHDELIEMASELRAKGE